MKGKVTIIFHNKSTLNHLAVTKIAKSLNYKKGGNKTEHSHYIAFQWRTTNDTAPKYFSSTSNKHTENEEEMRKNTSEDWKIFLNVITCLYLIPYYIQTHKSV